MNIRFLETALCLADCKNFRLAADRLHLTQAAVSSRIAVLEEEFGQRLFERGAKEVSLTPAGEKFVVAAADVLASWAALQQLMQKQDALAGVIRIGAVSSMAHLVLPKLISRIRRLHPAATLEIVTDDTGRSFQEQLKQGLIDFCLTAVPEQVAAGIDVQALCVVDMGWFGAGKLVAPGGAPMTPADLARYPIISYAPGSVNGERIRAYLKDTGADPRSFLTSGSLAAMVRMAAEGLGIAVIPDFIVTRELQEGSLHRLALAVDFPSTTYCAMRLKHRDKGDISSLSTLCLEICAELAPALQPWVPA